MKKRVVLKGYIVVPSFDLERVLNELPVHIELTRAEKGCLKFSVTQRAKEPTYFDVFEEFESEASFELHQERVRASVWGAVTQSVERHYSISLLHA